MRVRQKWFFFQLDSPLKFILSRIKNTEEFFISEINGREMMSQILNKYITVLNYVDHTLIVFSSASNGGLFCLFTTVIGTPEWMASVTVSLVFLNIFLSKSIACGYSLVTDYLFDSSKNNHNYYRPKDWMKNFCKDLRERVFSCLLVLKD